MKFFGYEPVAIIGALQAALVMAVSFGWLDSIGLDGKDDVALVVGVLAAVEAVAVAYKTRQTLLAPLTALFKALIAFGVLYGFHVNDEQSATIIAFITAFLAFQQRKAVDALRGEPGNFSLAA